MVNHFNIYLIAFNLILLERSIINWKWPKSNAGDISRTVDGTHDDNNDKESPHAEILTNVINHSKLQ